MDHSVSAPLPGPLPTPLPVIVEGYFGPVSGELIWFQKDRLAFWTAMALPGDATLVLRMPLPRTMETADVLLRPEIPTPAESAQGVMGFIYSGHFDVLSPETIRRFRRFLRQSHGPRLARPPPPPLFPEPVLTPFALPELVEPAPGPVAPPSVLLPSPPPLPAFMASLPDDDDVAQYAPEPLDPPDAQVLTPRLLSASPVTLGLIIPDHVNLALSMNWLGLTVTLTVAALDWLAEGEPVEVQLFLPTAAVVPLTGEVFRRWPGRMALALRVRPGQDLLSLVAETERITTPRS